MTIAQALSWALQLLSEKKIESAVLDAEALLACAIAKDRAFVLARSEYELTRSEAGTYRILVQKRSLHVPYAYLVGKKEFYGHEFIVNKYTMIPRPETELIIDIVLEYLTKNSEKKHSLLDVGTGCGCILICLALHAQNLGKLWGIDRVKRALDVARENACLYHLEDRFTFKRYNMLSLIKDRFDIIVANLPYLSANELFKAQKTNPELAWEPQIALLGGTDGLLFNTQLIRQAKKRLNKGGVIFFEIGDQQAEQMRSIAHEFLPDYSMDIKKDLCQRDRIACLYPTN